ncbi:hypothetical protein [Bosea sp. BK604]|uniref:hypothetical protein n=1 Tax=Bosea sp. BK604 TaxID=2512180 RepID=UPI00104473A7|nr:hypothetical protein [Bosea sp. BK604]TCR67266.1 hypothetical protein EV560_103325 [Bosea sp. BK604]
MRVKPLVAGLAGLVAILNGARADESCPGLTPETLTVRLQGIDDHGDPLLADGRRLRLVGLAPRQSESEIDRFATELLPWRDQDLRLVALAGPDRWGRLPARLLVELGPEDEPLDLAAVLLNAKAAWRLPDSAHPSCDAALKAAEAALATPARRGKPAETVDGHDIAALKLQAGRVVVLEGRIASVGERPQRSYLNFTRRRGAGASIVVSRRIWREMQDVGWTTAALTGRRVRARGVLGGADGLALELPSRTALELID